MVDVLKIESIDGGFIEYIDNSPIEKIICKYDCACTIYYRDKSSKSVNAKCSVYNRQYGIPVSNDGTRLFVGDWEKGIYAYDILSGRILWQFMSSRIRNIFVYSEFLVVARAHKGVDKVDLETGKLCASIKSGTLEHIFDLTFPFVFADTISGKHCVIDIEEMRIKKKYSLKVINPFQCLSLMIKDVYLHNNSIIILGTENYPQKKYDSKCAIGGNAFSREIDSCFNPIHCAKK